MSGKSKRKDKITPKNDEIDVFNKCIDLKRFAYDVIKYTALKFHVPESCIAVWEGSNNDYGRNDFILVVCIPILKYQIAYRRQYHAYFSQRYESNKLATPEFIGRLLHDVICKETSELAMSPLDIVHMSLSIACELFLFLYSKDMDLYPKQLATTWFKCYLNINKKRFEMFGGLEGMYLRDCRQNCDVVDAFLNKFIEDHCLPYHTTANNPDLGKLSYRSAKEFRMTEESLSQKDHEEMKKELTSVSEIADQLVEPPTPDGATGFNLPESIGLRITPLDQVPCFCSSLVSSSQDIPVSSPEKQPRHHRTLSQEERTKIIKSGLPLTVEQDIRQLTLDSSGTKHSSDQKPSVSTATGTTQSYKFQRAKPKVRVQNTASSCLQTCKSSLCSSVVQRFGQPRLDSFGTKQSSDEKYCSASDTADTEVTDILTTLSLKRQLVEEDELGEEEVDEDEVEEEEVEEDMEEEEVEEEELGEDEEEDEVEEEVDPRSF